MRYAGVVGYFFMVARMENSGVFHSPMARGGGGTVGNTMGLAVPKSSKVKKEAFAFAKWMMDDAQAIYSFDTSGWQPFRTNVDYSPLYKKHPALKDFVDSAKTAGYAVYDYENMPAISEVHNRMAERIMTAFKQSSLNNNPQGIAKVVSDMAEESARVLSEQNLLAK